MPRRCSPTVSHRTARTAGTARAAVLVALAVLAASWSAVAPPASALSVPPGTLTWVGGHGPNWSTAANWSPARAPADGDELYFTTSPTPTSVNDLVGLRLTTILIDDPATTLTGNGVALTQGVTSVGMTGATGGDAGPTVALDLDLPAGTVTLAGTMSVSSSITGPGGVRITSVPGPDAKLAYATVTYAGPRANTYTGDTALSSLTTLKLDKDPGALAIPSGAVTIEPNAERYLARGNLRVERPDQIGDAVALTVPDSVEFGGGLGFVPSGDSSPLPVPFERVGPISVGSNGFLGLGGDGGQPVVQASSLDLTAGAILSTAIHDGRAGTIHVDGHVAIAGSTLILVDLGAPASTGQPLTLIANDGPDPVTGTFARLPQDGWATFTPTSSATPGWASNFYRISYRGGDGNDVTVTPIDLLEYRVRNAYQVLLDRAADDGGLGYWSQFLRNGGDPYTFTSALTYSVEGRARVVRAGYAEMLGRPADPGGLAFWTTAITHSVPVEQFRAALAGSAEFASHPGAGSSSGFVSVLYALPAVFGRTTPDRPGEAYWAQQLDSGRLTRTQVALALLRSDESVFLKVGSTIPPPGVASNADVFRFLGGDY